MKIATWNIERLRRRSALPEIQAACEAIAADILVLTETDARVQLPYRHCFRTETPPPLPCPGRAGAVRYAPTEHRVAVYTDYPCARRLPTFDSATALCVGLETEWGELLVYGTVIGVLGGRMPSFGEELQRQMEDVARLSTCGNVCICGDLNCSFADNAYYTKAGRSCILRTFEEREIELLTADVPSNIDHIAVSRRFAAGKRRTVREWNADLSLSDHKGIAVQLL